MDRKAFLEWIRDKYVPEDKRTELPPGDIPDSKLARWIVSSISRHIHPDKFIDISKKQEMSKAAAFVNKYVDKLKGLAWFFHPMINIEIFFAKST